MEEARLTASMEREHPYAGERVELATKHSKESAIAPALAERLGLRVHTPLGLDTDALGTFTGEVERVGSPREVAARKARLALEVTGHWLGLASEGSFGPHPVIPFVPADDEWLALVDDRRGIVVYERFISLETNFGGVEVRPEDDLTPFLARARFPSHGLIVRPEGPLRLDVLYKGVTDSATLRKAVGRCAALSPQRRARVETDMRAHQNPTRMAVIAEVARRLALRLERQCPACGCPGWGMVETAPGLPCEACGTATDLALHEVWLCADCDKRQERPRADGRTHASAEHCPYCNP
ncbi:MAG TPA: DUF6671 family protein [Ktedonobacterales bacterium]